MEREDEGDEGAGLVSRRTRHLYEYSIIYIHQG